MKTIIFDELSPYWDREKRANLAVLDQRITHWENRIKLRGYIYLNEIYESLGADWNPDDENVCYRVGSSVKFSYEEFEFNEFRIIITQ